VGYGKCNEQNGLEISTDDTCGPNNGNKRCPDGECCSKYGYCGITEKHCDAGCQVGYGICRGPEHPPENPPEHPPAKEPKPKQGKISTNDRCGPENGNTICPNNKCCSKYGYCGVTEKHCNAGCQVNYGKCN